MWILSAENITWCNNKWSSAELFISSPFLSNVELHICLISSAESVTIASTRDLVFIIRLCSNYFLDSRAAAARVHARLCVHNFLFARVKGTLDTIVLLRNMIVAYISNYLN